jgi:hypothetical protein
MNRGENRFFVNRLKHYIMQQQAGKARNFQLIISMALHYFVSCHREQKSQAMGHSDDTV